VPRATLKALDRVPQGRRGMGGALALIHRFAWMVSAASAEWGKLGAGWAVGALVRAFGAIEWLIGLLGSGLRVRVSAGGSGAVGRTSR
jgi:hypothetical protein